MLAALVVTLRSLALICGGHRALALENLARRQQLAVFKRTVRRPQLRHRDRLFWRLLAKAWQDWRTALIVVQPDTVLRWHRQWLRRQWTRRSARARSGRPSTTATIRTLVMKIAAANPLWGAPRIHGELGKLGIEVSERTVSRLVSRPRRPPSQTWRTFLANHVPTLGSMDFFTVPTVTGRILFVFVVLLHQRRRIVHFNAHLPPIHMADYDELRQGELVFAFGSPEGLRNSVTMGIVSAVARQPDPDSPVVYVQTDAPINRGNSGGPLVNVKGELVGINTLILSDSGGSQGLGFAIPSTLVQIAYPRLRRYGDLHRGEIGVLLQTITLTLATGLGLSRDWGAMISDVAPNGPAEAAGLKAQDVVTSIDGEPIDGLPRLAFQLFTRSAGDRVRLGVLRGSDTFTFEVLVGERAHDVGRLTDAAEPARSLVTRLAIFGVDIGDAGADLASALRVPSGVMVVGHSTEEGTITETGLLAGDTIHGINGTPVTSVTDLQTALDRLKPRSPVALQIERKGQLTFLAFELD